MTHPISRILVCLIAGLSIGCRQSVETGGAVARSVADEQHATVQSGKENRPDKSVSTLMENENLIRAIDPQLAKLTRSVLNLELRTDDKLLFSSNAAIRDIPVLEYSTDKSVVPTDLGRQTGESPANAGDDANDESHEPFIWRSLFDKVDFFRNARFYAIRIADNQELPGNFKTEVGFEALARTRQNHWLAVKSKGTVGWQQAGNDDWVVREWEFPRFEATAADQLLFEDATRLSFSGNDFFAVQHSPHYALLVSAISNGAYAFENERQKKYFRHVPTGQHPSVSIVDINRDGWDDLYIVEQWRANLLFLNNQDGTFREAAADYGLDVDGYCTSAIFADFDNDGDSDLFLGRSLSRSQYLENQNGSFVDKSSEYFDFELPFLVSSVSACDFNQDGLLDIYLCTYGFPSGNPPASQWTAEFLAETERQRFQERTRGEESNRYLNAIGPPNYLIENRGTGFTMSSANDSLAMYANSLQATWSDYDGDGDADLYVCNDFARDFLFRNEQEAGFIDVTLKDGDETMMGFGMGVSWGDFDQDGRQDLYVSNMYSKAGLRIVDHFGGLDSRFRRSADGNRLYRNTESGLKLVSANEGQGLNVHKAGWSWGGQFVDVDSDGFLDIYVTSGYFTAPRRYATELDL